MSHPKRPRDPNQLAKSIIDIATGRSPTAILRPRKRARTRLRSRWVRRAGSVFVLNVVDGCLPSDLVTGSSAEIEEERRLLCSDDARQGRSTAYRLSCRSGFSPTARMRKAIVTSNLLAGARAGRPATHRRVRTRRGDDSRTGEELLCFLPLERNHFLDLADHARL
jgi:hypothetical protein